MASISAKLYDPSFAVSSRILDCFLDDLGEMDILPHLIAPKLMNVFFRLKDLNFEPAEIAAQRLEWILNFE